MGTTSGINLTKPSQVENVCVRKYMQGNHSNNHDRPQENGKEKNEKIK